MSDDTRPLTAIERRYLRWHRIPAGDTLRSLLHGITMGTGCLAFPLVFVFAVIFTASRIDPISPKGLRILAVFPALLAAAWIVFFGLVLVGRRKRMAQRAGLREQIDRDLAGGVARIHRFQATDIVLAYGDQRATRNYFVRLDDGRILFLGNWKPPACDLSEGTYAPDERGFPSRTFEIAAAPESLFILDVVGAGEYLRPVDEFDLGPNARNAPAKLESGSFVDGPWEELRRRFGG